MLLDKYLQNLQKLTKKKITYEQVAQVLGLGSKQAVANRVQRKQELKEWEVEALDEVFKKGITSPKDSDCIDLIVRGNVSASMGFGITVYDESQTGTCSISRKFLQDIGANVSTTEFIFAHGDSMEPTIQGGDRLIVDLSKKNIYDGKIYCIRYEGELYAKRLQRTPPSTLVVISDNQKYKNWEIDFSKEINFDFEVIGEVLYWGRIAR